MSSRAETSRVRASKGETVRLVEADIEAELDFHLQMLEEEFSARGLSPEQARAEAQRRFGRVREIFADCRRIRLRERIVIQRVQIALLILLAVVVALVFLEASSSRAEQRQAIYVLQDQLDSISEQLERRERRRDAPVSAGGEAEIGRTPVGGGPRAGRERTEPEKVVRAVVPAELLARLNSVWPLARAVEIARELAALEGPEALRVLQAIYADIESAQVRLLVLRPLVRAHPQLALHFLYLGATDASAEVREKALGQLSAYALFDFSAHPDELAAFWAAHGRSTAAEVLAARAGDFVARLSTLEGEALTAALEHVLRVHGSLPTRQLGVDLPEALRAAGIEGVLDRLVRDPALQARAWQLAAAVGVDEAFLRRNAAPLLAAPGELSREMQDGVYKAVAKARSPWASEVLQEVLLATPAREDGSFYDIGQALGEAGDPRAIPKMIGMIVADDTYKTIYGLGWFGLNPLTGVPWDKSHDGEWWLAWWKENRHSLPASVRDQEIPTVTVRR